MEIDEGDPYNEILSNKSINNLKSLNFFKGVESEVVTGSSENLKVINYTVDEKPTGEISAGAGVGTSGGSVAFSVKEIIIWVKVFLLKQILLLQKSL